MNYLNSPGEFDTMRLLTQVTHVHSVVEWVKQVVNNEHRIVALEKGIDADIYNMDRLVARRLKLQEQGAELGITELALPELKIDIDRLENEMTIQRNIVFKKSNSDEVRKESMHKMEALHTQFKELEQKYNNLLYSIEPELLEKLPKIYDMVLKGTDINTIKHVIKTFEDVKNGKISTNQAVNLGIDYEESRGTPKGLFDFVLEGPRLRNGTEVRKTGRGEVNKRK